MKGSPVQIARRFYEQLLCDEQKTDQRSALERYFEADGSVCTLARKGIAELVSEYGLEVEDARLLAWHLNGLATLVLRHFIEDQLTSPEPLPGHLRRGLLALVDGPTYGDLFKPNFAGMCPPDAIEAIHSPVAYAVWLKYRSEQFRPSEPGMAYALNSRRTDLDALQINTMAVHGAVSSVEVVSAVLERSIEESLNHIENLDKELSERRYPNGLPYHHPWATLNEMTVDLGMSLGTMVGLFDPQYPYFFHALPWGETYTHALEKASRLSPSLRKILIEEPYFPVGDEDGDAFYRENFGTVGSIEPQNLNQVLYFNQRTKLAQPTLEALLSVELFAPIKSTNVPAYDNEATAGHAFSVYINDGTANEPMYIHYTGLEATNRIYNLIPSGSEDLALRGRIDRLNRMIRLCNALKLPSHETDVLLVAIIDAETRTQQRAGSGAPATSYWMTDSTLQALGLFQMLRENYQCSAEEFAAFLGNISIFGRGSERSQFDRVFNKDALSMPPLQLDDGEFALEPVTDADKLTVIHICAGLNIDLATYFNLASLTASAHGHLKRNIPVFSSFFRLARLPQILGIAPNLALEVLNLLSPGWMAALVGKPYIGKDPEALASDALAVILRLEGWVRWCADSELDMAWALEHCKTVPAPPRPSESQVRFFAQIRAQLVPALFTEAVLQMAGVPRLSNARQWTNQLLELADHNGLVIHWNESTDQPYERYAREIVERAVFQAIGVDDQQIVDTIMSVLLSSRSGQRSVVRESLAVYGELTSDLALPVLAWSGGTVHGVLVYVLERTAVGNPAKANFRDEAPGDTFLGMLEGFVRRSEVTKALRLSVEFLTLYLSITEGVEDVPAGGEFTTSALYYLTVYNRAVKLSNEPEARLLSYLQQVNTLPDNLSGDGLRLVQEQAAKLLAELFDWAADEVRVCAGHVNGEQGYIRSLEHLDLLIRVRTLTLQSKLDAPTILQIAVLTPASPFHEYEAVANKVAVLQADPDRSSPLHGIAAVVDQVMIECEVQRHELIANSEESTPLTITVTRGDQAQKNVNIYWTSKLCHVEPSMSTTDIDGSATVTVHAGTTMGRDVLSYRLDAREPRSGPIITLRNDPTTFAFSRLDDEIYTREEKVGTDVTLRVRLFDQYGNPAIQVPVTWTLDPLFALPVMSPTNAAGIAEITFSSAEPLIINAPRVGIEDADLTFRSIEFTD